MFEQSNNYTFPMTVPNVNHLAEVLRRGLTSNFAKVTVEWVPCPDLTQTPFNLAAPGLCGTTAILQIGGTGYMFPQMQTTMSVPFVDFVNLMDRKDKDTFIIGGCVSPISNKYFGELTTNTLSTASGSRFNDVCRSRAAYISQEGYTTVDISSLDEHRCSMIGNFYVSEGIPGSVLKVYAKKRTGLEFIYAIQSALCREFPGDLYSEYCIGLGGVIMINNGRIKHHVIPSDWSEIASRTHLHSKLHYFQVDTPVIGVGMFLNTDRYFLKIAQNYPCRKPLWFTKKQFHTFGNCGKCGFYEKDMESTNEVEYIGYFHPAALMHRVAPNVNLALPYLEEIP